MNNAMTRLATYTLPSSGTASFTFADLPQTHRDLLLVFSVQASTAPTVGIRLNNDASSTYSLVFIRAEGTGGSRDSTATTTTGNMQTTSFSNAPTSASYDLEEITFLGYANTTRHKTMLSRATTGGDGLDLIVGRWPSTAAITTITIIIGGATFNAGTSFTIYGVGDL